MSSGGKKTGIGKKERLVVIVNQPQPAQSRFSSGAKSLKNEGGKKSPYDKKSFKNLFKLGTNPY